MSWSLRLSQGDFVVDGAHLGIVTRQNKLLQDIRCAILEKMGTDNLHPEYGSLIDGGRNLDGVEVEGVIGMNDFDLVALEIQSDLTRLIRAYQQQQLTRAKQDLFVYGRATLEAEEIFYQLDGIEYTPVEDSLKVTITIQTATDVSFSFDLPVDLPLANIA